MFWAVCTVSEECTDIRIGDLSARASVWHVFHSGQLGRRVARQEPGVAIAALVQNSFSFLLTIGVSDLQSTGVHVERRELTAYRVTHQRRRV